MKPTLSPIAVAILGLASTLAAAQSSPAPAEEPQRVEVSGIRASLQQALKLKREAESRVEVISAEDIGKMPDKNVADSLQRVPGVTISSASANEGGFDENDRVSMRGTSASLTQTLVNGHSISSGEWFVLNQTGTVGRSISYSLLPSELVKEIVVHKSSQAYLVEGGVTGSVDIITRKPLEFRQQLTVEGQAGGVYAEKPGTTDPQLSALVNWKNDASTFGVMLQAFSEHRHLRRDGQEILGYSQIKAGSAVANAHPDLAGVWYPVLMGSALFEQKREREGGLISVQAKPSNELTVGANAFTSSMKAANYNRNYMLWGSHILADGAGQAPSSYTVRNNTLVAATFDPVAGKQYGVYDQISRPDAGSDSTFFTADATWTPNERLKVTGQLGTTSGTGKTPTQDVAEWNTGVGSGASWALNGTQSAASWSLGNANNASPAGVGLGWIFGDQNVRVKDKENWGKVDGEYGLDNGVFTTLRFGARLTDHSRSSQGVIGQGPGCKKPDGSNVGFDWSQTYWCPPGTASAADPANFPVGHVNYPGNFGSGLGGTFPRDIWYYTPAQLAEYNRLYANRATNGTRENWGSEFGLGEKTRAAYLQSDLEGQGWSGNVGVRLVQTETSVTNNVAVDATTPGAVTTSAFGPYLPVTTEHTHTDVLPSMNLKFKLDRDLVARLALSRTMARPDYSALAGAVSLNPATASGSGGNPDLKPVRSNNLDLSLEYYYAPRALLSAGLFHMSLDSYVGYGQVKKSYLTYDAQHPQGQMIEYTLTTPVNTTGRVNGLELAWEQPFLDNFGVAANYTYVDAKEKSGGPLVGASKNTWNLVSFFENEHYNARIAYNFRSSFYSGLDRSTAFYQDDTTSLAASLGYKFSDKLSVSLDGHNLNNPKLRYYALNKDQPRSVYENGRQYYLTLRMKL